MFSLFLSSFAQPDECSQKSQRQRQFLSLSLCLPLPCPCLTFLLTVVLLEPMTAACPSGFLLLSFPFWLFCLGSRRRPIRYFFLFVLINFFFLCLLILFTTSASSDSAFFLVSSRTYAVLRAGPYSSFFLFVCGILFFLQSAVWRENHLVFYISLSPCSFFAYVLFSTTWRCTGHA